MSSLKAQEGIKEAIEAKKLPLTSFSLICELAIPISLIAMMLCVVVKENFIDNRHSISNNLFFTCFVLCWAIVLFRFKSTRALTPYYLEMKTVMKTKLLEQVFKESKNIRGFIVTSGHAAAADTGFFSDLDITILYDHEGFYFNALYGRGLAGLEIGNGRKKAIEKIMLEIKSLS